MILVDILVRDRIQYVMFQGCTPAGWAFVTGLTIGFLIVDGLRKLTDEEASEAFEKIDNAGLLTRTT